MLTALFFPDLPGVRVDRLWRAAGTVHLDVTTTARANRCPLCGRRSRRVHSRYQRTLADLPCGPEPVVLHLHARRFVCRVRWCRRKIFTERLGDLVAPWAQRTCRVQARLTKIGLTVGGNAGARQARSVGLAASAQTLLRLVRAAPLPVPGPVRVVGIDDFALRKGQTYGTIIVDEEAHRVLDLLPERTAENTAAWLRQHPEIRIISRDRGGVYAEAGRLGAPQAQQVADRFHLQKNVTEALERYLQRQQAVLRHAAAALVPTPESEAEPATPPLDLPSGTDASALAGSAGGPPGPQRRDDQRRADARARRLARYEAVMTLRAEGRSIRGIAAASGLAKGTVVRYLRSQGCPDSTPRRPRRTQLTPYVPYLQRRWAEGCHNAKQLFRELQAAGFRGGHTSVADLLQRWREHPAHRTSVSPARPAAVAAGPAFSPRQTCWLLLRPADALTIEERAYVAQVVHDCPKIALAQALTKEFATVLDEHDVAGLYSCLHGVEHSGIPDLCAVVRGMWLDRAAIEAAVTSPWSQGQVEGQVNRLKLIKREGFGRCRFDLLRRRVLHRAS